MNGDEWLAFADKMVNLGTILHNVFYSLIMGYFFSRFARVFPYGKKVHAYISGALFTVYMIFTYNFGFDLPRGVGSVVRIGLGFLFLYAFERERPRQKLFLSLLFYAFITLCLRISSEQSLYFQDFLFGNAALNNSPERTIILYFVSIAEDLIVFSVLLLLGTVLMHKFIGAYDEDIFPRDLLFLSLPFFMVFSEMMVYAEYYDMYSKYFKVLDNMGDTAALEAISYNSASRLLNYLLFYVFILVFIWCFFDIKRMTKEKVNAAILKEQTLALQDHVNKMEEKYAEIRSIRHDMNHHMEVLSALISEGKAEEAKEYLASMENLMRDVRPRFNTGNPVTDIIISERYDEALHAGIEFTSEFLYPDDFGFEIFDISGILGNAFSNAFAACKKVKADSKPSVSVTSYIKGNAYLIEMTNSLEGVLEIDSGSGLPKRASSEEGHGIGLQNMKSIAKKYSGDIFLSQEGDLVTLTVILQRCVKEND